MRCRVFGSVVIAVVALLASGAVIGQQPSKAIENVPLIEQVREQRANRERRPRKQRQLPQRPLLSNTISGSSQPLPPPGVYDLSIAGDMNLGGAIFKDGYGFLHDQNESTALGSQALVYQTSGAYNTGVGFRALAATTTGRGNTAMGDLAAIANQTGDANTAIGQYALLFNQYSSNNTAVGANALFYTVGLAPDHLGNNTAVGYSALTGNSYGFRNTGVGALALTTNSVGTANTAIGYSALRYNVGYDYGGDINLGYNTAVGLFALYQSSSAAFNTAVGQSALIGVDSGQFNTGVGTGAGAALTGSNSGNVLINSSGVAGDNNTLRIGSSSGTTSTQLNAAYIQGIFNRSVDGGSDATVLIDVTGKLGTVSSSRRYKDEIEDLGDRSEGLLELRPVSFRYKHDDPDDEATLRYGLIAEEVAEIYPELVVFNEHGEPETVKYHLLSAMLINELQRQRAQISELWRRLEAVERR